MTLTLLEPPTQRSGARSGIRTFAQKQEPSFDVYVREVGDCFVTTSPDIPGLNLEAESLDEIVEEIGAWAPDLLVENGIVRSDEPYHVLVHMPGAARLTVRF